MVILAIAVIAVVWLWATHDVDAPRPQPATDGQPASGVATIVALKPGAANLAFALPITAHASLSPNEDPRCVIKSMLPASAESAASDATVDSPDEPAHKDANVDAARARLLARMSASSDPYANAVAVWLDVDNDSDEQHLAERQRRLAAMAVSTQDPRLYSLALRDCWRRQDHPCDATLSVRRWTELEPANAMPWLMMMDEAVLHGDLSGLQEGLFHVTQAKQLAERLDAPLQPIIDAAGTDADSLLAARALTFDAIGRSAAQVGTAHYPACARTPAASANIWQECLAMADLMIHRSDSLMAVSTGESLRQRLTGEARSAERSAKLEHEFQARMELFSSSSCDDLRFKLAVLRREAVEGQVATLSDPSH